MYMITTLLLFDDWRCWVFWAGYGVGEEAHRGFAAGHLDSARVCNVGITSLLLL